jgi:hypothetical protein
MGYKSFTEYNVSEVVVWINAIGMTDRAADFEENAVDGKLLVELTDEDLRSDLGFSGLQAKKFRQKLAFALELTAGGTGNGGGDDGAARIAELEAENTALQNQLNELNAIKRALYPDPGMYRYVLLNGIDTHAKKTHVSPLSLICCSSSHPSTRLCSCTCTSPTIPPPKQGTRCCWWGCLWSCWWSSQGSYCWGHFAWNECKGWSQGRSCRRRRQGRSQGSSS